MALPGQNDGIAAALRALRSHGVVPAISPHLRDSRPGASKILTESVLEEVPAWSDSANPDVRPDLQAHLDQQLDEVEHLLAGSATQGWGFVEEYAEQHAAQRFPLEALLHTYRCMHKVLSAWVRDAALSAADENAHVRRVVAAVADLAIEVTDAISTAATSAYVDETRRLAEAEGDRRNELMNILLQGYDESDGRAARLLRKAGYLKQRQSYCVVAARSVNPAEMASAARAQRMADSLGEILAATPLRALTGVRDNLVIAVVSGTRRLSGWTAPQTLLADRLIPHLRMVGPAALIGLSNDRPSTSHIPRAAAEARLALEFASFSERVMPYSLLSLKQLLVAQARDGMASALPAWLDAFTSADDRSRGKLGETLRGYADADMNVLQAAKHLKIHPNTIYARAQKISDITGKNLLSYHDLTELLLATELHPFQRAIDR